MHAQMLTLRLVNLDGTQSQSEQFEVRTNYCRGLDGFGDLLGLEAQYSWRILKTTAEVPSKITPLPIKIQLPREKRMQPMPSAK
jgi:hypothetical protein